MGIKSILSIWVIFTFLLNISPCLAKDENKSVAKHIIELFDSWCLQNSANFRHIDQMAKALGAKEIDKDIAQGDLAISELGGKFYLYSYEEMNFLIGYANGGGCSIVSQIIDKERLIKLLKENYRITLLNTLNEGIQIQEVYRFNTSSTYAGGLINVFYGKPSFKTKVGTLSFFPVKNLNKILNSSTDSSCILTEARKRDIKNKLCKSRDYGTFRGQNCIRRITEARAQSAAIRIITAEKCGFKSEALELKEIVQSINKHTEKLYECLGVDIDLMNIYHKKISEMTSRYQREYGSFCPQSLKTTLQFRLPQLIKEGKLEIKQGESFLDQIGIHLND